MAQLSEGDISHHSYVSFLRTLSSELFKVEMYRFSQLVLLEDYTEAIKIAPQNMNAYIKRCHANFNGSKKCPKY